MIYNADRKPTQQLSILMDEVIKACYDLYDYTFASYRNLSAQDDNAIAEIIAGREKYVEVISDLESRIDCLLEEQGDYIANNSDKLLYDFEEFREKARCILRGVTELDMSAMELMGTKMQKYKEETLKLRNKKNISAYISSGVANSGVSHYDVKK